jgi:hypothetical protein
MYNTFLLNFTHENILNLNSNNIDLYILFLENAEQRTHLLIILVLLFFLNKSPQLILILVTFYISPHYFFIFQDFYFTTNFNTNFTTIKNNSLDNFLVVIHPSLLLVILTLLKIKFILLTIKSKKNIFFKIKKKQTTLNFFKYVALKFYLTFLLILLGSLWSLQELT